MPQLLPGTLALLLIVMAALPAAGIVTWPIAWLAAIPIGAAFHAIARRALGRPRARVRDVAVTAIVAMLLAGIPILRYRNRFPFPQSTLFDGIRNAGALAVPLSIVAFAGWLAFGSVAGISVGDRSVSILMKGSFRERDTESAHSGDAPESPIATPPRRSVSLWITAAIVAVLIGAWWTDRSIKRGAKPLFDVAPDRFVECGVAEPLASTSRLSDPMFLDGENHAYHVDAWKRFRIARARIDMLDRNTQAGVCFVLASDDAGKFEQWTAEAIGKHVAIRIPEHGCEVATVLEALPGGGYLFLPRKAPAAEIDAVDAWLFGK